MIDLETAPEDDILARTICGEARGEGDTGMAAVANVILNRVASPRWWGHTVKEVCMKGYQFSCWNLGDPNRAIILNLGPDYSIYNDALAIAQKACAGSLPDITNGATSYYAKGTPEPKWAAGKEPCAVIGHHLFFNDIEQENPMTETDLKREAENAILKRFILWVEKEAHLAGADIEVEVTSIMSKLRPKAKPPVDPSV